MPFNESLSREFSWAALLSWDLFPAQFDHYIETVADKLEKRGKPCRGKNIIYMMSPKSLSS